MYPKNNSNQLVLTRVYDAPVKLVWDAWTDVKKVAKWWGPRGFTITTKSKDLRPGGQWIYTMHGPDGVDYPNITTYFVVEPMKRLEYDHGANENQKPLFRVNVSFSEKNEKTTMVMTMTFESPERAKELAMFIKQASGNSTWDRLGEFIDEEVQNKEVFYLNRAFEAPIEKVFDMWADFENLQKWLGPKGTTTKVLEGEIKEGSSLFYMMGNDQFKMYGRSTYHKIKRPEIISFQQEFCDEKGNNSKHPAATIWPATWLTTVTFAAEDDSTTRLTLKSEVVGKYTSEELAAFVKERSGMTMGWNGSLDLLEEILRK